MANTYYDSELTAEEIEEVLEAINGILSPANNGKVLAISNGKFEARSVQWGGGEAVLEPLSITENGDYYPESGVDGFDEVHVAVPSSSPTIRSLSVTQNGTYTAPSGVDGYSPVTVNVSGGGGSGIDFDVTAVDAVKIWTGSTGAYDASLYIQQGTYDQTTGIFTGAGTPDEVLFSDAYQWIDFFGMVSINYTMPYWKLKTITKLQGIWAGNDAIYNADTEVTFWVYTQNTSIIMLDSSVIVGAKRITNNGTYYPSNDNLDFYNEVEVDVQPNLQNKITTENGVVQADPGYDGLGQVTVNVSGGGGGYAETVRDYAQFTGNLNGIQLPFYFDENTGIEIEFMLTSNARWQMIFGTWDTGTTGNILWNRATNDIGSSGPLYIGTGTLNGQEGKSVPNLYNTKHTIKTNINGHSYVDDTIEYSYTPTAPGRLIKNVLGGNRLTSVSYSKFVGRIYSYKIYNRSTGLLLCSLIPVTITIGSFSIHALKDTVNNTYYISSNIEADPAITMFTCGDDE